MLTYTRSGSRFTVYDNDGVLSFDNSHPKYEKLVEFVRSNDLESLKAVLNFGTAIKEWSSGSVTLKQGVLYYNDRPVSDNLCSRILNMLEDGFDSTPMVNFIENLYQNPSYRSVEQLYLFLSNKDLPITPDGHFLGHKSVTKFCGSNPITDKNGRVISVGDYVDIYTGCSYRNNVGDVVTMDRNAVSDDPSIGCHSGLHVGSLNYAKNYGGGVNLLTVKVNPADAVCVPYDDYGKIRVCKYKVVSVKSTDFSKPVMETNDEEI